MTTSFQEWATERPTTHGEMLSYLELVDAIVDGERLSNRSDEFGGPASSERDLDYALTLLTSLRLGGGASEGRCSMSTVHPTETERL